MHKTIILLEKIILVVLMVFSLCSCKKETTVGNETINENGGNKQENTPESNKKEDDPQIPADKSDEKGDNTETSDNSEKQLVIKIEGEGNVIFDSSSDYYRYGPSIIEYEDGSMDAWFSSPGNSGSQWDWIVYRHSDDGEEWSDEKIVLKPTPGSKDQCSVCDPAVIYFNDFYYLAYTATDYYEGKGSYNMAFVSRSRFPDGPFEKWNGNGWGGDPEPIIFYDGAKENWGIGEVSFVIYDEDLYVYYTYIDVRDSYIGLCKADLTGDWPSTLRSKGPVLYQTDHDSVEIVYDEFRNTFLAFSIDGRMMENSSLCFYTSENGKEFKEVAHAKDYIEDYANNLGVAKGPDGHQTSDKDILFGYAYGKNWGRWSLKMQKMRIEEE